MTTTPDTTPKGLTTMTRNLLLAAIATMILIIAALGIALQFAASTAEGSGVPEKSIFHTQQDATRGGGCFEDCGIRD